MPNPNLIVQRYLTQPNLQAALNLIARALLAYIFIVSGWGKLFAMEPTLQYMASQGVPSFFYPLVVLLELGGGLAILFGFQTRGVALVFVVFNLASACIFHGTPDQATAFMKNISMAGGFLVLALQGAQRFSLDHALEHKSRS
ncbi:hypothetical protein AKN88_02430 [Thiopseudomonas alkaliphila]|uniref:Oxidoreductase n=1 Tax=Thiopseudomonas alkaliphila TaxID=1697053 RepID=A0A0K1XC56_9GAMM|nr:DoxX family protein [Thiopseudomonas alkaliphila]AKX58916.1 hypothetical protein AKN88_02430 [Thiopseudomonas alkaliphila]